MDVCLGNFGVGSPLAGREQEDETEANSDVSDCAQDGLT